jgi:hypothetical protein
VKCFARWRTSKQIQTSLLTVALCVVLDYKIVVLISATRVQHNTFKTKENEHAVN